jgi:hypothetical protein
LCDVVCWNGKIATPVGFSFSVIVLLLWYISLLKSAPLYPFCLNASLKCRISALRLFVSHIVFARFITVVRTACFCEG